MTSTTNQQELIHKFDAESAKALNLMMKAVDQVMEDMDISRELREYVHRRKGLTRKVYPTAAWVKNPHKRMILGTASCLHCLGLMLLDDIIDADTEFSNAELIVGTEFCTKAYVMMKEVDALSYFFDDYREVWMPKMRHVIKEPVTDINSLEEWENTALIKAGEVLACYTRFCFAAEQMLDNFETVRPVFRALGIVFTVVNDYAGRARPTEQHSNIFALINRGLISKIEAVALIERYYQLFIHGIKILPPQFNFYQPITTSYEEFRNKLNKDSLSREVVSP